jgi:hypothetical protein
MAGGNNCVQHQQKMVTTQVIHCETPATLWPAGTNPIQNTLDKKQQILLQ